MSRSLSQVEYRDFTIPVVFHLFKHLSDEEGLLDLVDSQLAALNRDFSGQNASVERLAEEEGSESSLLAVNIQFCLADTKGGGIIFKNTPTKVWPFNNDIKSKNAGGSTPIQPEQYLNIWVATLPDTVSGYAQVPEFAKETDGVVIDYRYFGQFGPEVSPYNEGKTLTHLVANYLGLEDIWGNYPCANDNVDDTPLHNAPNMGCNFDVNHVSTCPGNPIEMTMNLMDNSYDECSYLFTYGQKQRMITNLSQYGPRHGLTKGSTKCAIESMDVTFNSGVQQSVNSPDFAPPVLSIQPNPARDAFNLSIEFEQPMKVHCSIYSLSGQLVYQSVVDEIRSYSQSVNSDTWPPGLYMVSVIAGENRYAAKVSIR